MMPGYSNFVLQLCFNSSIQPYYENSIMNKLSNQKFKATYDPNKSQPLPKLFTVLDIPDYLDVGLMETKAEISLERVPQYKGYLINLTKFSNVDEFINKTLSRNPRKNLRAKLRKLELNHKISYHFYHGKIDKNHYDYLFNVCYILWRPGFIKRKFTIDIYCTGSITTTSFILRYLQKKPPYV